LALRILIRKVDFQKNAWNLKYLETSSRYRELAKKFRAIDARD